MAQFRGTVQGNRGEASRIGHKSSGLTVKCNGWQSGVTVHAKYDKETDKDFFYIYRTSGSSYKGEKVLLGVVDNTGFTQM